MKVLLIQPKKGQRSIGGEDFHMFEPLALEYLAAGIENEHEVKILDMRLEDTLESSINTFQPDVIGISAYTVHVNTTKILCEKIKNINREIFTVVGGHHATVMPEDFLTPFIDLVVMGEGVQVFKEIISRLSQKKGIDGIPGTAYLIDGKAVINPKNEFTDLDSIPFPSRKYSLKYRKYYYSEWLKPLASMRTSKGCNFRCKFCALWKVAETKYLTRTPENILKELATIEEKNVYFADDESLLDVERMMTVADLIIKSGMKKNFFFYGRSDTIVRHPGLIAKWKEAGLKRLFVGLEFFRDSDLKFIKKGSTVQINIEAVKILKDLGVEIYPSLIIRQEFDENDFRELKDFCLKLDFNFIGFCVLTPFPGTDYYNEVKDKLITTNYDYSDLIHTLLPTKLPIKKFYEEYIKLFNNSRTKAKQIEFMRQYPLREWPSLFKIYYKFNKRLKNLWKDYE
ncbi:MAG: radical SAM protein [bacterium]|nr:radical SAM protein [bacterium]